MSGDTTSLDLLTFRVPLHLGLVLQTQAASMQGASHHCRQCSHPEAERPALSRLSFLGLGCGERPMDALRQAESPDFKGFSPSYDQYT